MRRIRMLAVGLALSALAGCASADAPLRSTPLVTEKTSPAPDAADRPTARFGSGCTGLGADALVQAIFAVPVSLHDFLASENGAIGGIPRYAPVAQAGGLLCEWSNGIPYSSQGGGTGFIGIQVAVLPDAAAGWERYESYYGPVEGDYLVECPRSCYFDVLVDDYWISGSAEGDDTAIAEDAVRVFVGHLVVQAKAFGEPSARWTPVGLRPVPPECEVMFPESVARAAVPGTEVFPPDDPGGGSSLYGEASRMNGDGGCGWHIGDGSMSMGVRWMNGGAWLATELAIVDGGPVAIAGLEPGEAATAQCVEYTCVVNLAVEGNWVEVWVSRSLTAADPTAAAVVIAEHVVAALCA